MSTHSGSPELAVPAPAARAAAAIVQSSRFHDRRGMHLSKWRAMNLKDAMVAAVGGDPFRLDAMDSNEKADLRARCQEAAHKVDLLSVVERDKVMKKYICVYSAEKEHLAYPPYALACGAYSCAKHRRKRRAASVCPQCQRDHTTEPLPVSNVCEMFAWAEQQANEVQLLFVNAIKGLRPLRAPNPEVIGEKKLERLREKLSDPHAQGGRPLAPKATAFRPSAQQLDLQRIERIGEGLLSAGKLDEALDYWAKHKL